MPGSILGVITINWLNAEYGEDFEPYLLGAVAVALMFASSAILYRALFRPGLIAKERESALLQRRISKVGTIAIGATLGFVLGLTSVGSGALIGLVLILLYKLSPRRVVGTDVFHAAVLLWTAGLAHFFSGNVDLGPDGDDPDRVAARGVDRDLRSSRTCRSWACATRSGSSSRPRPSACSRRPASTSIPP